MAQKEYKLEDVHKKFQKLSTEEHQKRAKSLVKAWIKYYGKKQKG